ncbi:MAG: DUF4070 domain-containing protein [Patescibacteria group bacterium]
MNILLVYPEYPETFWSFKQALKFVAKKSNTPPLGLLTVASMLPREWQKKLVDVNVEALKDEDIARADMVFISAMIVQKKSAQAIINRVKALGKKVVCGGPVFTSQPERFTGVDHFVLNEAEVTLPLFLRDLKEGKPKSLYTSNIRPEIVNTPPPDWSLINFNDYATTCLQYSRGCPFDCEFCDIIVMNGRGQRAKAPEQMLKEIELLYEVGWRGALFIVDDNFIGNKANVKKMLPLLIKWQKEHRYPFKFLTEASTNLADDEELLHMMSAANFYKVFLGIETPCVESLKECGKFQNATRNLVEAVKVIQQNGMQVMGGFIVGFDNDPPSIFETQINFIQQVGIVTAMVGLLTVLPQTRLWHRLKAERRLLNESTGENTDGTLNFVPKMDIHKLKTGYKKILAAIYSPHNYYQRINTFINNYKPTVKSRFSRQDFKALLRSFWRIGVLSEARILYWKLIFRTFFMKARALPVAIELAVYGVHLQKVADRVVNSRD